MASLMTPVMLGPRKDKKGKQKKGDKYKQVMPGGSLQIQLAKPYFTEGDVVQGQIVITANAAMPVGAVTLKACGSESCHWEIERTRYEGQPPNQTAVHYREEHDGHKDFFRMKFTLGVLPGVNPGMVALPFAFQLPADLTGTYVEKEKHQGWTREFKAKVTFKLKVRCSMNAQLSAKTMFVVQELPNKIVVQQFIQDVQRVTVCCCIPKGTCTIRCKFEKNVYMPGETANVVTDLENNSTSDVQTLKLKLWKNLTLTGDDGAVHSINTLVAEMTQPGVKHGEKTLGRIMPLTLPGTMQSTTDGKHVKCKYLLQVEGAIDWAPDVDLKVPVHIAYPPIQLVPMVQAPMPMMPPGPMGM